jgi:hypothetical protein
MEDVKVSSRCEYFVAACQRVERLPRLFVARAHLRPRPLPLRTFSFQVATFDGDTPKDDRDYIRENCNVVSLSYADFRGDSALTLSFPPLPLPHPRSRRLVHPSLPLRFFPFSPPIHPERSSPTPTCSISPSFRARRLGAASSATSASSSLMSYIPTLGFSDATSRM